MSKKLLLCVFVWLSSASCQAATARPAVVKAELVDHLIQLMIRCFDYKLENEMFREALNQMQQILQEIGPVAKEKEALKAKIDQLLMIIAMLNQEYDDSDFQTQS